MNFLDALHISSSGLSAQRVRMNVISSNLANANTTRTIKGGPYKRKDVVFAAQLGSGPFQNMLKSHTESTLSEVQVVGIITDPRPPQLKYDPQHPAPGPNEEFQRATRSVPVGSTGAYDEAYTVHHPT